MLSCIRIGCGGCRCLGFCDRSERSKKLPITDFVLARPGSQNANQSFINSSRPVAVLVIVRLALDFLLQWLFWLFCYLVGNKKSPTWLKCCYLTCRSSPQSMHNNFKGLIKSVGALSGLCLLAAFTPAELKAEECIVQGSSLSS